MAKPKKKSKKPKKCGWCGHSKSRHSPMAGCIGDGGPGANCACDEFIVGTP